jgi:cbb3-type cytochrome oxidase subunit 1
MHWTIKGFGFSSIFVILTAIIKYLMVDDLSKEAYGGDFHLAEFNIGLIIACILAVHFFVYRFLFSKNRLSSLKLLKTNFWLVVPSLLFLFLSKFFPHAQQRRYFSTNEKGVEAIDYLYEIQSFVRMLVTFAGIFGVLGVVLLVFNVLLQIKKKK